MIVLAVDKDLRNEKELGRTKTDNSGRYQINYGPDNLSRATKRAANLIVRVLDPKGEQLVPSIESAIICNAPFEAKIDLTIGGEYRGPSEYEQLLSVITPLLNGTSLADLTEDDHQQDVTFLSCESGANGQYIAFLVLAHKLTAKTKLPPEVWYGFFRENLPTDLWQLLAQSSDVQRQAIEAAIDANIIPQSTRNLVDKVPQYLKDLTVKEALQPPPAEDGKTSLSQLLSTILKDPVQQTQFLTSYVNHKGPIEEFWRVLGDDSEFKDQADDLQFTLQLGALTSNHLPLLQELQRMKKENEISSIRDLAKLDDGDWQDLINKQIDGRSIGLPPDVPGKNDQEKALNYVNAIKRMISDAFPTTVIAYRVQKDDRHNSGDVRTFFKNILDGKSKSTFELSHTDVGQFLKDNPSVLNGVADKDRVKHDIKCWQRIFKVSQDYDAITIMVNAGLDSTQAITRIGRDSFVKQYSRSLGGAGKAKRVYENAEQVSATALHLLASYSTQFNRLSLHVLPTYSSPVKGIPDWGNLFGSLDMCDCTECQSVHSPAAYLVDILHFLNQRKLIDHLDTDVNGNITSVIYKKLPTGTTSIRDEAASAKDVLFLSRRPDIGQIELTCKNTNTPLPYVDLVNEVLENAIAPPLPAFAPFTIPSVLQTDLDNGNLSEPLKTAFRPPLSNYAVVTLSSRGEEWRITEPAYTYLIRKSSVGPLQVISRSLQTLDSPEELKANPKYVNAAAYERLRQEIYPWGLPFDLWSESTHSYLDHLGVPRYKLMRTFQRPGVQPDPTDIAIASEHLGLSSVEQRIITDRDQEIDPLPRPPEFWGFARDSITWVEDLKYVHKFMDASGLSYAELSDLLKARFINPGGTARIESSDHDDPTTCDTTKLVINNLSAGALRRIDRFVRLWRKLGWTMGELDMTISALQTTVQDINLRLGEPLILQLSHIKQLREDLGLSPIEQLLTFWSNINTIGDDSLYQRLFQNPTVLVPSQNPTDPTVIAAFKLNTTVDELDVVSSNSAQASITKHMPTILGALGISAEDLQMLRSSELSNNSDLLSLSNLTRLYRVTVLAHGLKLTIKDTLNLKSLTGINPFEPAHIEYTISFIENAKQVRESGFSIPELDYLMRHQFTGLSEIAPPDAAIALTLDEIRNGLRKIAFENIYTPDISDINGELIRHKLSTLPNFNSKDVDDAMSLLDGSRTDTAFMLAFIDTKFSTFLDDTLDAKIKLVGPPPALDTKEERFAYVLEHLLAYLRRTLSVSLVKQKLGETLKLEAKIIEELLIQRVDSRLNPSEKAVSVFLAQSFAESDPNTRPLNNPDTVSAAITAFSDQFQMFRLLHKIAMIITKFKVTTNQLRWLFDYGPQVGWLNLNALPINPTDLPASVLFARWLRTLTLFQLRDKLPMGESSLSYIFSLARNDDATYDMVLQSVSGRLGWGLDDLQYLAGPSGFALATQTEERERVRELKNVFRDEQILFRLLACFAMMKRLGSTAEQSRAWAKARLTEDDARSVKQVTKAKYENANWLEVAKALCDRLREKQRIALAAYLVAHPFTDENNHPRWHDANGLYEQYLIDVEMGACMETSRVVQAIGSVQMFTWRCLMNLETKVQANARVDKAWREWDVWMKNYSVWGGNRKIFLYPENWIYPQLRDGKSPFFKDLENELLQNAVTADTAETAFLHYLQKLDAVARLEIVGVYHQLERDDSGITAVDILHVFGRTLGTPHVYYYRQRVDSARWTAWEKVDVDIEGDHLIPVLWNRRRYLIWPVFIEATVEHQPIKFPVQGESINEPDHFWKIQLAWSEYKNGKWEAKRITTDSLETPKRPPPILGDKNKYVFNASLHSTGELEVLCVQTPLNAEDESEIIGKFIFTGADGNYQIDRNRAPAWIRTPRRTLPLNMMFAEENSASKYTQRDDSLYLESGDWESPHEPHSSRILDLSYQEPHSIRILYNTPGVFHLLYSHQDEQFTLRRPFFFQDETRTFFVIPRDVQTPMFSWATPGHVDPNYVDTISKYYYRVELEAITNPVESALTPVEPPINDLSFPEVTIPATEVNADSMPAPNASQVSTGTGLKSIGLVNPVYASILSPLSAISRLIPLYRTDKQFLFQTYYHPYVSAMIRELNRDGIDGLLQRSLQIEPYKFLNPPQAAFDFKGTYLPELGVVDTNYPNEEVDFEADGAYSIYNWELFFQAPLLIASLLSQNQRFEEAQQWFHYIFNPTDTSGYDEPQKYWQMKKFFETTREQYRNEQIENLLRFLALSGSPEALARLTDSQRQELRKLHDEVGEWRDHPFKPHLIARLRTTAYQKTTVMKYLDNLIAWADQLYRRGSSQQDYQFINEAAQLYVLASQILGPRPTILPPPTTPRVQTYNSLEPIMDDFSNALVQIEHLVPIPLANTVISPYENVPLTLPKMLYFCVPANDKLLGYWDTVAGRLSNIRQCKDIEGLALQIPLYQPVLEPETLVRAAAAGIDISSALNDINAALPHYRFTVMVQKAEELSAEVKALGAALLSVLEKRDAEALSLLRSSHEISLLEAVQQVKEQQKDEAEQTLQGLLKSKELTTIRYDYYAKIAFMNASELAHLDLMEQGLALQTIQAFMEYLGNALSLIPEVKAGAPPTIGVEFGGREVGGAIKSMATYMGSMVSMVNTTASMSATLGGHQRRWDEWKLQEQLAKKELEQIEKQIAAAEIRKTIADLELHNHELQQDNVKAEDDFMHSKFTDQELYEWMIGQIASIYFQSYQLAYDVAKRAERAYRYELGLDNSSFIQFGYWDSLKKGLLSGEHLYHDLKRMEMSYLDLNKREYELTKNISLAMLNPLALIRLKQTGNCFVDLPEWLFDMDYPGHYMRRIRSIGLTIPCITGPYTNVNCTVTLLKNSIRRNSNLFPVLDHPREYTRTGDTDQRFADNISSIQSIATSSGQNDSGLFEVNSRDERYLPFEGAGAISQWNIELDQDSNQFDFNTISDVILHLRYTAREGGEGLKTAAKAALPRTGARLFSLKHEFSTEWYRFLTKTDADSGNHIEKFALTQDRFAFYLRNYILKISRVHLFITPKIEPLAPFEIYLTPANVASNDANDRITLQVDQTLNGMLHAAAPPLQQQPYPIGHEKNVGEWTLKIKSADLPAIKDAIDDIWLLVEYSA